MSSRIYFGVANLTKGKGSWVTLNFEAVDEAFGWAETKHLQQFYPPMGGSKSFESVPHTETRSLLAGSITNEESRSYFGDCKAAGDENEGAWIDEDIRLVGAVYRTVSPQFHSGANKVVV